MPIHKLSGGGWQWGKSGKKYYGKGAKKKAIKQMIAVKESGWIEKMEKNLINKLDSVLGKLEKSSKKKKKTSAKKVFDKITDRSLINREDVGKKFKLG
jgi:hypothetical protein